MLCVGEKTLCSVLCSHFTYLGRHYASQLYKDLSICTKSAFKISILQKQAETGEMVAL